MNRINSPYRLLKLASAPALVPPLEAIEEGYNGYNLIHCHKCGATEDPSVYDGAIGYKLIDHDECFSCFFDEHPEEYLGVSGHRAGVSEAEREAVIIGQQEAA